MMKTLLRPATKFFCNTPGQQWSHIVSEVCEAQESLCCDYLPNKNAETLEALVSELIDIQMSCETMLAILGLNKEQRNDARRRVIAKNEARGYYHEVSSNDTD